MFYFSYDMTELLSAMPLSGFMRRLLLQVLMEDEKIIVSVRNSSGITLTQKEEEEATSDDNRSFPLTSNGCQIFHPRYGSGRSCQCITMNLNAKTFDVILKLAGK